LQSRQIVGATYNRKKLSKILDKNDWNILLIEHKDRLTRFGFNYFNLLLKNHQKIEVINQASDD
jgi:predicted site-specific integrase-resolvase